jgi:hypothetical protein
MSYYLHSDTKDFNTDNIIFGDKISSNNDITRYYIYYNDKDESKEIYFKLSKIRMIFNNFLNQKYSQINIPIYPLYSKTLNDIQFIETLEMFIIESFKTKSRFISLLSRKKSLILLRMSMKKQPKITSTIFDKKEIAFSDFKINGEIEMVVKLSYVWFNKSNKTCGLSCQLGQIKYYGLPEQLYIDFIDEPVKTFIPPPPPLMLIKTPEVVFKNSLAQSGMTNDTNNITTKKIPTQDELLAALKRLKKVS